MDIIAIIGLCLTACIISKVIERSGSEIRIILIIAAVSIVTIKIIGELSQIISVINELFYRADIDDEYLTIIFKGMGICYITQIAGDCCRDCGESSLAAQIELAGKVAMVIISLPLFRAVIGIIEALII